MMPHEESVSSAAVNTIIGYNRGFLIQNITDQPLFTFLRLVLLLK